jgi:hypothetical protein
VAGSQRRLFEQGKAWDLLVQFTREKIPDADLCFVRKKVDSIRASFRKELRRVRDSSIVTAAATRFDELILDTVNVRAKFGVRSCVCGEIYPSPAPESSSPSRTRTCMGTLRHELSSLV